MHARFPDWTLFLDRDGVINRRLPGDYVRTPEQFEFLPGVLPALTQLRQWFGRMVVVTNQQGIGKGLLTEEDLRRVHEYLHARLREHHTWVDGVYFCPHLAQAGCSCRKPAPGLAHQAKAQFPEILFAKSILVGDSDSDIRFGKNLGMVTVRVGRKAEPGEGRETADGTFDDLAAFTRFLVQQNRISVAPKP